MSQKLSVKRRLLSRSERVKSVELHPTEPWMLTSLYNGLAYIWNIETKQVIKTLEVSNLPVRVAKFVARKNWVITGSDDSLIRVFNYNTLEHVTHFGAHLDFIRSIAVHPTQPFILSCGDDGIIRLWNWEKKWEKTKEYRGHTYVVMQVVINPKDNNQFATASLDKTVKVWQLGTQVPNFSLKHEKGVNCVDYHPGNDKPYMATGEDGGMVRIWDYQNKSCVHVLQGHSKDVNTVVFHASLPLILSAGCDGTLRMWHSSTYKLEKTLNFGLERVWMIACQKKTNALAMACDDGSLAIRIGRDEPAISMDSSGKILWAKQMEIQQANTKAIGDREIKDGERLAVAIKDLGSCEIYPHSISHSPNGRFVVVSGDGEYIIYTAMALRSKSYGPGLEFVWSSDSSMYATMDGTFIKVFKNFKENKSFKPSFVAEGIFGDQLLGVKSTNSLVFYDWESLNLIRRIEISPKHIFWSANASLVCLATQENFYILKYNPESVQNASNDLDKVSDDGIEDAFEVLNEVNEIVSTGTWVGDCFIYINNLNRLNYYVGGEVITIAHLDRVMHLLGYIQKENRLYLGDKELNIVSYSLLLSLLEYQTAVMRKDFQTADKVLPTIPLDQRNRIAQFLEKQGFLTQALAVSIDPDHRFDLSIQLKDLATGHSIAKQCESVDKWKELSDLALKLSDMDLAQESLLQSQDLAGLLLLASSAGNRDGISKLAQSAEERGQNNVEFLANFVLGRCEDCLEILIKTGRLPEAAFFARTYLPSQISRVVCLWQQMMASHNKRVASAIADPTQYENLFPGYKELLKAEEFIKPERLKVIPAAQYSRIQSNADRVPVREMQESERIGVLTVSLQPSPGETEDEEEEGFVKVQVSGKRKAAAEVNIPESTPVEYPVPAPGQYPVPAPVEYPMSAPVEYPLPEPGQQPMPDRLSTISSNPTGQASLIQLTVDGGVTKNNKDSPALSDLERELDFDLENFNIDDFDITELDLDSEDLLSDLSDAL
ncbi:unnamed protein product [Lymnaea stagnalis]|uniref:Coatomer subunit beta' n=1 Tax=Lymnaea stagnalis TaxID=6523 RepID=A0AAV2II86_LYMST